MIDPVTQDAPIGVGEPVKPGVADPDPDPADGGVNAIDTRPPPQPQAESGCTQAQLRRFIKSRPYVPMHELRRRFELNGQADDVSPMQGPDGVIYVGLPGRESRFMAELLRQGDIGVELCRDPAVPIVVGVFAIKPVTR